jgi:hypothetical protein
VAYTFSSHPRFLEEYATTYRLCARPSMAAQGAEHCGVGGADEGAGDHEETAMGMTIESARAALSRPVFGDEQQIAAVRFLSAVERWEAGERLEPWEVNGDVMVAVLGGGR